MELNGEVYAITAFAVGVLVEAAKPVPRWDRRYSGVLAITLGAILGALIGVEINYGAWTSNVISGIAGATTAAGVQSTISSTKKPASD